jgi:error-prone DNA polymerase
VVHLLAQRVIDRSADLSRLSDADLSGPTRANHPRNVRVIPKSRDFH